MKFFYEGSCDNCGGKIRITADALLFHSEPPCGNSKSPAEDVEKIRAILEKADRANKVSSQ
jgi:hypothetical protein